MVYSFLHLLKHIILFIYLITFMFLLLIFLTTKHVKKNLNIIFLLKKIYLTRENYLVYI
jgi:hypothetical protein